MTVLENEKVKLRPEEKKDIDFFLLWFNNPRVTKFLQFYLPLTRIQEEKWIEQRSPNNEAFFVIEAKNKEGKFQPIGTCGLHQIEWKNRRATFGIAIGEEAFWGKGIGTEVINLLLDYGFNQLNLWRIEACAYDFNERSIALQKRAGFQVEGRRRKAIFKDGCYVDEVLLGILKEDWKKQPKSQ